MKVAEKSKHKQKNYSYFPIHNVLGIYDEIDMIYQLNYTNKINN